MFVDNAVPVAPLLVRYKKSQVNRDNHMMLHSAVPIKSNQLGKNREGQKARPGLTQHRKISQDGAGESEEVMNYPASHSVRRCYEFGPFQLNTLARLLLHEGREVPLQGRHVPPVLRLRTRRGAGARRRGPRDVHGVRHGTHGLLHRGRLRADRRAGRSTAELADLEHFSNALIL